MDLNGKACGEGRYGEGGKRERRRVMIDERQFKWVTSVWGVLSMRPRLVW